MTDRSLHGVGFPSVKRSFKYRFYPTDAQAVELSRTFGCVRKVYNLALAARAEAWKAGGERMGYGQTSAMLTLSTGELCSACGAIADAMPLSVREWTCESCGTAHDRDGNAALDLLAAGPAAAAACGADVRPHRESSSRSGQSVAKQESPLVSVGIPSC
ncbi:helix-turn-helix domain-containing protein [Streptomyces sp. NPDC001584]|uniref:helix-turn-helix domain-containing protein n=1 Tax=Streptomyces sp. NPDC001584 TaxID=3154521 RepID=UPI00331787F7